MKALIVLVEMIFLHCFADYHLQGVFAQMKAKRWWIKQAPSNGEFMRSKYRNDYKIALAVHAIEWSFITTLPLLYVVYLHESFSLYSVPYIAIFIINAVIHYIIDDAKVNKYKINLIQDQGLHFGQILAIWLFWWGGLGWT